MPEPIAIVGMAAVFPGAPDLPAFAANLERGVDAITAIPPSRIDPVHAEGFPCSRGGFIAPTFDPVAFGIMPRAAAGAEPDQLLALEVAARALDDAGGLVPRERTGVIVGRGGYLTPGMARLSNRVRTAEQLATTLAELLPELPAATVAQIRDAFRARAGELGADAAIGLVPNLAASRIANRLDLRGPAYTVDAACASSLLAIDQGCRELETRRCDAIVAGGVHVCHDVTLWSVFAQLGALSRTSSIRPFDRRADGILIGEGAGLVVLRRLADAERDGDRIYAVIRGTGVSSDGREASAMRPSPDGQLAALAAAWRSAGRDPAAVGLVEAHGTGTPAGDEVELAALARFFGPAPDPAPDGEPRAALGSVKSMIGHAMPAAGAAGLIKAALALHRGVLPPSLHCEEPHPQLARTRFRVLAAAEPWGALPRTAGVSAFGFGGINAHVVLEAHASAASARRARAPGGRLEPAAAEVAASAAAPRVLAIAGDSIDELRAALDRAEPGAPAAPRGAMRLAMLDPTPERRALAHKVLDRGRALRGNRDLWFAPRGLAAEGGTIAFLFPGIEAAFAPDVADVARAMGAPAPAPVEAAIAATGATPRDLELRGAGVFALGRLLAEALARLGVQPAVIAGHSMGEWTGMAASEMIPPAAVDAFVAGLSPGSLEVPDVLFVAVGCGAEGAGAALDGLADVAVSHDNCPHQSILCGRRGPMAIAVERLRARGVLCQELPFRSGFHSPLLADYLAPHRRHLAALALQPPRVPLWSATTCAPYPDDPAAIRALAIDHLVRPVRFRELVERLHDAGVRAFVQLGVGSLAGFVGDTLRGRDHLALAAASAQHGGLAALARVRAGLFADGFCDDASLELAAPAAPARRAASGSPGAMPLELGVPLIRLAGAVPPLALARADRPSMPGADGVGEPVLAELLATLEEAAAASRAVVEAYRAAGAAAAPAAPAAPAPRLSEKRTLSVDAVPALADHCFYRQAAGAPMSDRYPVVPMTMTIELMLDAARRLAPGRAAVAVEDVRAYRWLAVAPPAEVELVASARGPDTVEVELPGYARATVRLADRYPDAPAPRLAPLARPRPAPFSARTMYDDRWMFHGPGYQGVVELGPLGDDGVDGAIEALPAPGALLDCAGQLMGWWVMHTEPRDRLAMPVRIERIALYGPHPPPGARVECRVRIRHVGEREVRADLELCDGGRTWAQIAGWEDRRFDSDDPVWAVLMYPERNALAVPHGGGYVTVAEHWRAAASRELMMRRYLGERERAAHEQLGPRARRGWLLGRIAIKDAVRQHLWANGAGALFPAEVRVGNEPSGRPTAEVAGRALAVSVAHKDELAAAIVGEDGEDVGIDVEKIDEVATRTEAFLALAFTPRERALAGADPERLARLWAAKEAVGKLRGTGVTNPRRLEVQAAGDPLAGADRDRFAIDDDLVETARHGDHVVAWTRRRRS
jgi:3-oxoacyl-(acyl-carrier-protein) synthase/malonyl CoA-acyl carrier protein transacylase/phosphopantetheinyl transferase